jgi:hypothetical protein
LFPSSWPSRSSSSQGQQRHRAAADGNLAHESSGDDDISDDVSDDTLVRPAWMHGLARVFPATVVLVLAFTGIAQDEVGFFQHADIAEPTIP